MLTINVPEGQGRKIRCMVSNIQDNLPKGGWWDPYVLDSGDSPLILRLHEMEPVDAAMVPGQDSVQYSFEVLVLGNNAIQFHNGFLQPFDEIELFFQTMAEPIIERFRALGEHTLILERGYGYGVKLIKSWGNFFSQL
jgi:hypothetical protein